MAHLETTGQDSTISFDGRAACWEEDVVIPTYGAGKPNKNPMFLEKRVYQGSSGVIYPHPVIDSVDHTRQPKTYRAVFLENRYLRIMVLPELGGRVQMAVDKTNGYHFVYYNRVIKPALVGLAGPWISGGIEFNWPQHHRPSTFEPVDYAIEHNPDGSHTLWCSEVERMFRTKGMVGFTLRPDVAALHLSVQLYNRTDKPQTFLWWANPAVHVNDDYQSIFPPDVHAVMDHGKRAVSDFPIATGTYYKVNYGPGTDISRYRNIPVPTSFMAYHSDFDFIGCYDHGRKAGMMHVANHHLVPGKKQWTWGNGDFGQAWDRQLTDEDGPYIELMCGAFTDNQPDFSWLQPGEEKRFTQVFMPYKDIGGAKNATEEAIINLEVENGQALVGVYVTRPRTVRVELLQAGDVLYEQELALSPEAGFVHHVAVTGRPQSLTLRVTDADGRLLIAYTPLPEERGPIPPPAQAAPAPADVATSDELYLHGLHLEQYRHATYSPEAYYHEALRRDPEDSRCNNALGLLLLRRGQFAAAEGYFRRAVKRLTMRNPNPYDGEAWYNLGLALRMQGRFDEAFDAFYKATWNAAQRASSAFELARIACRRRSLEEALELLQTAIAHNAWHHQALHLRAVCLRLLGRPAEALAAAQAGLAEDGFNFGLLYERSLLDDDAGAFISRMRGWVHNYTELALDYMNAGLYEDARRLLLSAPAPDPMVYYYAAWCSHVLGDAPQAAELLRQAAALPPDYCFPNAVEAVPVLSWAIAQNPADGHAPYYLGNFWYAHRQYEEAIAAWELSCERAPRFATPRRNLGLAYMNKRHDAERSRQAYEQAFELDPSDARVLYERDQLYRRVGMSPQQRLAALEPLRHLAAQRDDLMLELITLLNIAGRHEDALDALRGHIFHPWEGGEGKVAAQYMLALVQLARSALASGAPAQALEYLEQARSYPPNLNEGKLAGAQGNHILYFMAEAYAAMGQHQQAQTHYQQAVQGMLEPSSSLYYNDQPPDMMFYQGLAYRRLNQPAAARDIFSRMLDYGRQHLNDDVQMDYFAVSLPNFLVFEDDLNLRNRVHCHYMMALGLAGLGDTAGADEQFSAALALDPSHVGAHLHRHWPQES
jgi:tetratricopeptide (TPR) repeat protein